MSGLGAEATDAARKHKAFRGYRSYGYLQPGADFRVFELARELERVPSAAVAVSAAEEARVGRLLEQGPIVSFHDHPSVLPQRIEELFDYRREGRDSTGYLGLSRSPLDLVFDNLADGEGQITSLHGWKWDDTLYDLGMRLCDLSHQDFVQVLRHVSELDAIRERGQLGLVLAVESATPIENELDRLDILYGFGVRAVGIAYSEANQLGAGLAERHDGGLTGFGERAVRRMNQLGLMIDCSHAGDRTTLDAIKASRSPISISHAGARTLWPTARMKPDEVLRALAERGGVIGIEAAPHTTLTKDDRRHGIESYMAHFEYCCELVGIEHVAFGPDTTFGDHVGLHRVVEERLGSGLPAPEPPLEFERVEWVDSLESPAEALGNVARWLVKHGYSDGEILLALGGNVLRLMTESWEPRP